MSLVPFKVPAPARKAPARTFEPRFQKPLQSYCDGCVLQSRGAGYVPPYGTTAPIVLVGEGPWYDEVALGIPMAGASGAMLERVLKLSQHSREDYRIVNLTACAAPGMKVEAFPGAVAQCGYWRDHIHATPPQVLVPLGTLATRRLLNLQKVRHAGVENFHGTVTWSPEFSAWVVPTYHPSHLARGATNLMGVMKFDLARAHAVAEHGWAPDPGTLVIDPPLDWFRAYAAAYVALTHAEGPWAAPLAVDIETPDKGTDEGALVGTAEDASYEILRLNLSFNPDEGVTVPGTPEYLAIAATMLSAGGAQYYWYKGFDYPRLVAARTGVTPTLALDAMWMWKALQSDLPQGLGFVAPFYSRYGAWKHLSETHPGQYAAIDGLQTRRVGDGLVQDLTDQGRWEVFSRHMHDWHRLVLQPATDVGIPIDRARLTAFKTKLDAHAQDFVARIQPCVPEALRPLTPKMGLTRPPAEGVLHTKARTTKQDGTAKADAPDPLKVDLYAQAAVIEKLVLAEVNVCTDCGKQEVAKTHNCQPALIEGMPPRKAIIEKRVATVRRWYWQEPFNPDSPAQLLAYLKHRGHAPGKSKQTGKESTDRETLQRLARETGDPLYALILDYRAVQKIRGTYVDGTFRRLDREDRVHPETTFKPSTMRTSQTNPNYQNVVADKGSKDSLAAGFRNVVVARGRWVEEGSEYADAL